MENDRAILAASFGAFVMGIAGANPLLLAIAFFLALAELFGGRAKSAVLWALRAVSRFAARASSFLVFFLILVPTGLVRRLFFRASEDAREMGWKRTDRTFSREDFLREW